MKMLYQNAVYKSLNLNMSPSNSSARSGNTSRELSIKSRDHSSASKNIGAIPRVLDQPNNNFKLLSQNNNLSSERKYRIKNKKDHLRDSSEGQLSQKHKFGVSQDRKSAITQQFFSPSDSRKLLKYKAKNEKSVEKNKMTYGGKTQRSKGPDNLYLSYRRSSKTGLRNALSNSKTKLLKEGNSMNTNDTFEKYHDSTNRTDSKHYSKKEMGTRGIPHNYHTKNTPNAIGNKTQEVEMSRTVDSARNSEISQQSTSS